VLPLRDENPTRTAPVVTVALIIICVAVWIGVQRGTADPEFTFQTAAIPCEVVEGRPLTEGELEDTLVQGDDTACTPNPDTPPIFPSKGVFVALLYSMFMHGGWLHLAGNMLFLWVFGNNIEDTRGKVRYLIFYLLAGLAATAAHIAIQPASTVPLVGASGAIAGVMGAYLVLFPNVPIRTLVIFFFITSIEIKAKWLLGFWLVSQFFVNPNDGVAWMAHVGGFVFGVAAGLLWKARADPDSEYELKPFH
jgi:membrane associated rhomboid family serine protease